jgi:hypothetical protein
MGEELMKLTTYKGIIEIPKTMYNALKNTISGNKDYTQETMEHPYYDSNNKRIVATNGRCLIYFQVELSELPEESGYYSLVTQGKKYKLIPENHNYTFPNYSRVIPEVKQITAIKNNKEFIYIGNLGKDSQTIFTLLTETQKCINIEYLKPLKDLEPFTISTNENETTPVVFENVNSFKYIVMPIRKEAN